MKSFIEFLEESKADIAFKLPGMVANMFKTSAGELTVIKKAIQNYNLPQQKLGPLGDLGPGNMPTNIKLNVPATPNKTLATLKQEPKYVGKGSTETSTKALTAPETATKTSSKTLVAPQVSTNTDTKTLTAPETATKTDTKSITPTKPPEPPKPPKPRIGQEPIPPKPFKIPNWVLGKSGFLSQNPGFIPSIKGHGRFYSP